MLHHFKADNQRESPILFAQRFVARAFVKRNSRVGPLGFGKSGRRGIDASDLEASLREPIGDRAVSASKVECLARLDVEL